LTRNAPAAVPRRSTRLCATGQDQAGSVRPCSMRLAMSPMNWTPHVRAAPKPTAHDRPEPHRTAPRPIFPLLPDRPRRRNSRFILPSQLTPRRLLLSRLVPPRRCRPPSPRLVPSALITPCLTDRPCLATATPIGSPQAHSPRPTPTAPLDPRPVRARQHSPTTRVGPRRHRSCHHNAVRIDNPSPYTSVPNPATSIRLRCAKSEPAAAICSAFAVAYAAERAKRLPAQPRLSDACFAVVGLTEIPPLLARGA
jgi:hypothetical protein